MKLNSTRLRTLMPVVTLAGTFCLALPAYAGHGGHEFRQMRLENLGKNNFEIRRSVSHDIRANNQVLDRPTNQLQIQRSHGFTFDSINNNRLKHSAFLTDSGSMRTLNKGLALDLTSSDRSIVLGEQLFSSAGTLTIKVGGEERTLTSGSKVTAAEYVAIQQTLKGGSQTLTVDLNGRGIGGQFSLDNITDGGKTVRATELVIPEHVTASGDFSRHADGLRVTNDLVNYGSISAYSSGKNDTAKIAARDIDNNSGATISTSAERLNLSLRADRDINNAGSISSSGDLLLSAGRSINNSGSFNSSANITLDGNSDSNLLVNNTGGTITALSGAINVRSAEYNGTGNTNASGGDLFSRELNLFSGQGTTDVAVNEVTGVVNSSGSAVHVSTHTDKLLIGSQCLVGDPTYYNVGDIELQGNIVVGETLAIIASGNITRKDACVQILARSLSGAGCDINIIAGANVITGSGETGGLLSGQPPITENTTKSITFSGASGTGGVVDLSGTGTSVTIDTSATGADLDGGNLTIAAYADASNNLGKVILSSNSVIITSGNGAGKNGGITIVGGGVGGDAVIVGAQIVSDGGTGSSGDITIATAQPAFSSGSSMTFDTFGAILSGNKIVAGSTINASGVQLLSSISASSANINVHSGTEILVTNSIQSKGLTATASGGNISLVSDAGPVVINGNMNVSGGANASGGTVTVSTKSDAIGLSVFSINADGGTKGGSISLSNTGTAGISTNGNVSAVSLGDGGQIAITSGAFLKIISGGYSVDGDSSGKGGSINLQATKLDSLLGLNLSALGGTDSALNIVTTTGGITAGNDISIKTDGKLTLNLNGSINADGVVANGLNVDIKGGSILLSASTSANPLLISANGINGGNGGNITYTDGGTNPTVVGQPLTTPKGIPNFLALSAHAGPNNGDSGTVTLDVGGDLIVNPNALDVASSASGGAHNGGTINLSAGNVPSKKVGKLLILSDLNVAGANGGGAGNIALSSEYTKAFVIGVGKKVPRSGIFGTPSGAGNLTITAAGIQILTSIAAGTPDLNATGKGSITTADGVVITGGTTKLHSDTGSINVNLSTDRVLAISNSTIAINSVGTALIDILFTTSAGKSFTLDAVGTIGVSGVQSLGGNISLHTTTGDIASRSFAPILATNGSITLQTDDINNGDISFAFGPQVVTSGTKGGSVTIAIGAIPKKPVNSVPDQFSPDPNFVLNSVGKGKIYFGAQPTGITTSGTVNINAIDKNVIFSNGSNNPGANQIAFVGNNTVTADPPIKSDISSPHLSTMLVKTTPYQPSNGSNIPATQTPGTNFVFDQSFNLQTSVALPTDLVRTAKGGRRAKTILAKE